MVSWASRPQQLGRVRLRRRPRRGVLRLGQVRPSSPGRPPPANGTTIAYSLRRGGNGRSTWTAHSTASRPMKLAIKPGGTIYLGAGWNGVDQKPAFPFHGSLARVRVWDRALSHREVRNARRLVRGVRPRPGRRGDRRGRGRCGSAGRRGATGRSRTSSDWRPAVRSVRGVGRLGRSGGAAGRGAGVPPPGVTPGRSYAWRVDQLDADGKVIAPGTVWRFATDSGPATSPFPRDRVAGVPRDTKALQWTPGRYAQSQTVYFGADRDAVAGGSAAAAKSLPAKAGTLPDSRPAPGVRQDLLLARGGGQRPAARRPRARSGRSAPPTNRPRTT